MEFKMRANVVMSKSLAVEADNLLDAMKKAEEQLENIPMSEFEYTNSYFDEVGPIKWMDESKYQKKERFLKIRREEDYGREGTEGDI